jgi:anaerobic selenocysteine-containing dehydrogenase
VAVVEDGRFVKLEPDPSHPTGKALCAKGRAAPELVYHPDRLLYPMRRTRPKGDPDPGWERISWDEALDITAARLQEFAAEYGPESVVFACVSPSTSAADDSVPWIQRLVNAYGSPNFMTAMELCGWGRHQATRYTFGAGVPGSYMPDLERAGCILFWGYNPNLARLAHATATVEAQKRGAKLIVVDPRRTGSAKKADVWLQVRPGTDTALALGITNVMIQRGWYDRDFIQNWTNGPLLVRADNGRFLRNSELSPLGSDTEYVAWNPAAEVPVVYDAGQGVYEEDSTKLALFDSICIQTIQGDVLCRPAFDLVREQCRQYAPERVEEICGIPGAQVEEAARLLWEARPVAYYAWSGVEMQSNSTQIARAIAQLYTLTGSLDMPGGNVLFAAVPSADVMGSELITAQQRAKALGVQDRPLGPSRAGFVTSDELYRAIQEQKPYTVHGLVVFGSNILLSHSDSRRGREALKELDFHVHADLFMNPTAEMADIVLPVASAFEREGLKIGFEISPDAQSHVQLRPRVAQPRGEARSDTEIVFELARRMGLGQHFWDGDVEAGYRYQLGPSGITLEELREHREGIRLPQVTSYCKYSDLKDGGPRGFNTPTRKIELYSETMVEHGYPPLPEFVEPAVSPRSRPELAEAYPLILTCTKNTLFCETQHRGLPSLRRQAMEPEVEIHPGDAAARGIEAGDWVRIETPKSSVRARAKLTDAVAQGVVCGQHGWWQACEEIGAPGYDPFSEEGANFNMIIGNEDFDPVSGSVPHRAYVCEVRKAEAIH